jgi:hypothetical protein
MVFDNDQFRLPPCQTESSQDAQFRAFSVYRKKIDLGEGCVSITASNV